MTTVKVYDPTEKGMELIEVFECERFKDAYRNAVHSAVFRRHYGSDTVALIYTKDDIATIANHMITGSRFGVSYLRMSNFMHITVRR